MRTVPDETIRPTYQNSAAGATTATLQFLRVRRGGARPLQFSVGRWLQDDRRREAREESDEDGAHREECDLERRECCREAARR